MSRVPVCQAMIGAMLAGAACAATAASDNPHAGAFVSEYVCSGERIVTVAYPAPGMRASEPVRLAWQGSTIELRRAAPSAGLRWSNASAGIAWTTFGRNATLTRMTDGRVLASGCIEQ